MRYADNHGNIALVGALTCASHMSPHTKAKGGKVQAHVALLTVFT